MLRVAGSIGSLDSGAIFKIFPGAPLLFSLIRYFFLESVVLRVAGSIGSLKLRANLKLVFNVFLPRLIFQARLATTVQGPWKDGLIQMGNFVGHIDDSVSRRNVFAEG